MPVILHNPPGVFPPYRCFSHATEICGDARVCEPTRDLDPGAGSSKCSYFRAR